MMARGRIVTMGAIAVVVTLIAGGCASMGVEAWERDVLAKPEMQPSNEALDRSLDDHIYFSKETSSGGRSFGGGGCGCN